LKTIIKPLVAGTLENNHQTSCRRNTWKQSSNLS